MLNKITMSTHSLDTHIHTWMENKLPEAGRHAHDSLYHQSYKAEAIKLNKNYCML